MIKFTRINGLSPAFKAYLFHGQLSLSSVVWRKKKYLIYLVNCILVQQLAEEIYHCLYVHFRAEHSIHRMYINIFLFRCLASRVYQCKKTYLFMAYSAKHSPFACELWEPCSSSFQESNWEAESFRKWVYYTVEYHFQESDYSPSAP